MWPHTRVCVYLSLWVRCDSDTLICIVLDSHSLVELNVNSTLTVILSLRCHAFDQAKKQNGCTISRHGAVSGCGERGDDVGVACCVDRWAIKLGWNQLAEAGLGLPHVAHHHPHPRLQLEEWHICPCRGVQQFTFENACMSITLALLCLCPLMVLPHVHDTQPLWINSHS